MFSSLLHGLRSWKSAMGVAILATVAIALGIGSTAAIFSVIQGVLLNPLGIPDQNRYSFVWNTFSFRPQWRASFSYPDELDFAARARTVDPFGCFNSMSFNVSYGGQARRVVGTQISASLLPSTNTVPYMGRWFREPEKEPTGFDAVVLSMEFWKRLGSDPAILGRRITMNGKDFRVVGVAPSGFQFPSTDSANQLWVPLHPDEDQRTRRGYRFLTCLAKAKPGVKTTQIHAELERITHQLAREHPEESISDQILLRPLLEEVTSDIRPTLILLLWAAGVLLLITCANVAGLFLARSVIRARETAVRVALGSSHWQLAVQFFIEGLVVSISGALLGTLLSYSLVRAVLAIAGSEIPRADQVSVDSRVLFFALALSVLCGLLFSLAPLWQAHRVAPNEVLSEGVRSSASARSRNLLRIFVISEIALSFTLLAVASSLLYQLGSLRTVHRGFDIESLATMTLFAPPQRYPTPDSLSSYERRLLAAVEGVPGVEGAGFTQQLPLKGWGYNTLVEIEGRPAVSVNKQESIENRFVSPSYFKTMGIPILKGRVFNNSDVRAELPATMTMVINQTMEHLYWPRGHAIGARLRMGAWDNARFEIVGVVGDTRNAGLMNAPRPEVYLSYLQEPMERTTWAIRSHRDVGSLARDIRAAVLAVDPQQPIYDVTSMREVLEASIYKQRLESFMTSFFAVTALILALLGVYGAVSYAVRQRTAEIGTRMAVGATSRDLLRLVIGDGLRMAGIGIAIGVAFALILAVILRKTMHLEIDTAMPLVGPTLLLSGLTGLACFFPAWRATRVSPMVAIRNEPEKFLQKLRWTFRSAAGRFSHLIARGEDRDLASEAELLAEIAEVSRRAESFSEAIRAALECVRAGVGAQSLALFVRPRSEDCYRCYAAVPDGCGEGWSLDTKAALISRLRSYPGAMPIEPGELEAMTRWAVETAPQHLPEVALLRAMGAALAVRIAVKKEVSGVLLAGHPVGHPQYGPQHRRLLAGVSAQLAMMIENARLTDRMLEQERLRRDLQLGAEVQKRLLPASAPSVPWLQLTGVSIPARGVGGDYYDFIDLGNQSLGIALADVAGKGIAAALIMSVVQASLRSLTEAGRTSLASLAARMNRLLHRSTGSNSYATFFYAEIDPERHAMRYVNAGHNPPYLLRSGGAQNGSAPIEELGAGGTIIGMFAQADYEEAAVQLAPGDTLIAFTDGVPEALNPADEEYGEDRLKDNLRRLAHLPVAEMAARLLDDLKGWIADAAQYDDLTFILMKVE